MVCPYCDHETKVTNSRPQKRSNQVWRRRQCLNCKAIFTTHEIIDFGDVFFVSTKGTPTPFSKERIAADIMQALQHRSNPYDDSYEITSTVIKRLSKHPNKPVFLSAQISLEVSKVLKRFDNQGWLRYTAEHPSLHV